MLEQVYTYVFLLQNVTRTYTGVRTVPPYVPVTEPIVIIELDCVAVRREKLDNIVKKVSTLRYGNV